jgi:hypothetical protein
VPDRVTETIREWMPSTASLPDRLRTTTRAWLGTGSTSTILRIDEASADGRRTWSTTFGDGGVTNLSWTGRSVVTSGTRYLTNRSPEGAMVIETVVNGRPITTQRRNSAGTQIGRINRAYDPHGRLATLTDDRNGTSTWQYYTTNDLVRALITPPSGTGDPSRTTLHEYDVVGRVNRVTHPDGNVVHTSYTLRGEVSATWGARTYPVEHTYDPQGRMKSLKTWQNHGAGTGAAVTQWNYDEYRGWLISKQYQGRPLALEYEYTPGGRLKLRRWERNGSSGGRLTTTYRNGIPAESLPAHGDLDRIVYGPTTVGTSELRYTYDRAGRRTVAAQWNGG